MSEKILLIDGHSILNRAFYGLPDLTNMEGRHTGAVYGFLTILMRIMEEEKPDYLTVAFDLHHPTFRHVMYDAYKGTRKGMPEELREQVPLMKQVLQAMGIRIVTKEGYEADDILGTIATESEKDGLQVTILSGDRDLLQLATEQIMVRVPKTVRGQTTIENYHTAEVIEKFGVTPPQIVDLKALMGDSSDNIPGLPGVGEKTAAKIIGQFGTVENAWEHVDEIKPNKAKESMKEHYDLAVLSKKLAKICVEAPLDFDREEARVADFFTPEAYDWFKRLEFKNLLSKFEKTVVEDKVENEILFCENRDGAKALFEQASKEEQVGISILVQKQAVKEKAAEMEESLPLAKFLGLGTDEAADQKTGYEEHIILACGLCFEDNELYCISVSEELVSSEIRDLIRDLISKTSVTSMDLKSLMYLADLRAVDHFDVSVAAYLLNPLKSSYSYDDIAKEYLDEMLPAKEDLLGKKSVLQMWDEKREDCQKILAYEAYACRKSREKLETALAEAEMTELFQDIELPLINTLQSMEVYGIRVNAQELKAYGENLKGRIAELETSIQEQAGEAFNINSPKQLGVILFEKLAIPGGKKTKTGYSTAADVLEKLAVDYPIVKDILEYRQLTKLKSTYADGLFGVIASDGRIHSTFNQTITATGRISSTEPNLQNIPVRTELGRLLRRVFIPEDGFVFLDADYSQIELRVLAHMSNDEKLIQAYQEAQDIHRLTASQVFGVPFDEVTPLQRRNAKAVNFGIVYGISSFGLSQDLSISRKEAQEYIQNYFLTYPGIKQFLDDLVADGKEKGHVSTIYGRRRPVPELASSNFMQRSFGERVAMNAPVQGTAADIIKIAMNRVNEKLQGLKSRLILQVHDELLIETAKDEIEVVSEILMDEMKEAAKLQVPLEVDMHQGDNWYEAK